MRYVSPGWPNSNCAEQESTPFALLPMLTLNVHRMGDAEQSVFPLVTAQTWNCNVDGTDTSGWPLHVFCEPTFRQNALWTVMVAPLVVTVPAARGRGLVLVVVLDFCLVVLCLDACFVACFWAGPLAGLA
jgi:hypothetical protein